MPAEGGGVASTGEIRRTIDWPVRRPNNDLIIYTDPGADPYTNNDKAAMLSQNHANCVDAFRGFNYPYSGPIGCP
jgi:hypothetical protein